MFRIGPVSSLFLLLFLAGCGTLAEPIPTTIPTITPIPADGRLTLHPERTGQTMIGFGASGAWWAQDVGGWDDGSREQIIQLLFDEDEGIGLSIYRYNIGGGPDDKIPDDWRQAESFEVAPGVYDWTLDANAMWVLRAARAAGVNQFVAFANSPPARMTVSGRTNGDPDTLSNLAPEMYREFAQYLVDVVRHLQDVEGIPVRWLSPINEPQWDWKLANVQEGSHYEPDEVAALTRVLIDVVAKNELDVKISVFEAGEWWNSSVGYYEPLLSDPVIRANIDHLAIHSYWSTPQDKARLVQYLDENYPDLEIEMTEWVEMEQGYDRSMDSGLVLANTIHDDLTIGRVISWQYWIAVSRYNFHDGLIYVLRHTHKVTETKRLWTMGNYSRYVRPGYQRLEVDNPVAELKATAFRSPDEGTLVMVVINNGEQALTMALAGLPAEYGQLRAYQTSADLNLELIFEGALQGQFEFAPQSVTTLVYER